jgi:hypothetical protein
MGAEHPLLGGRGVPAVDRPHMTATAVRAAALILSLLLHCAAPVSAQAPPSPAELLRVSDVALTASVAGVNRPTEAGRPVTYVVLQVGEVYKGWIPEARLVVREDDPAARFRIHDQVLLFLGIRSGDRVLAPIATWGKWDLAVDSRTGERIARHDESVAPIQPFGRPAPTMAIAALRGAIPAPLESLAAMSRVAIDVRPRRASAAVGNALDAGVPGSPQSLAASVVNSGDRAIVDLFWQPPAAGGAPASYRVDAGSAPGMSDVASLAVAGTSLRATVSTGFSAFVRVYAENAAGTSAASNEVQVVAATALPASPRSLDGSVAHGLAKLMWIAPSAGRPVSYIVEAGSSSGLTDIGIFETNNPDTFASGFLPPRLYFLRVRAKNSAGSGAPSNEISFAAPGSLNCNVPSTAPTGVSASVNGSTLTLNFTSLQLGVTYVLQAGSTPGALDIATLDVGRFIPAVIGGVPPGHYYLRLVTRDPQCGVGPPSNEIAVAVP